MKLTQQELMILIITLFAIVTSVSLLMGIGNYLVNEQLPIDACWMSVQIQSALEPRVAMEQFKINLKCPPEDTSIKETSLHRETNCSIVRTF